MKKINNILIGVLTLAICCCFSLNALGQCVPVTPTIIDIQDQGNGDALLIFDVCAARASTTCNPQSAVWYVGFYGHGTAPQNGLIQECGVAASTDCDPTPTGGDLVVDLISNGGDATLLDGSVVCLDTKSSTCESAELFQLGTGANGTVAGEFYTWNIEDICSSDPQGFGVGVLAFTFPLCPGQTYDVYMWEHIYDVAFPTQSSQTPGSGASPPSAFANDYSCGNIALVGESPATPVFVYTHSGTLVPIDNPTLIVSDINVCTGDGNYTNTHQVVPSNSDAAACAGGSSDTQPIPPDALGVQGALGGDLVGTSDLDGSLDVGAFLGGTANHVLEINCRDIPTINITTPEGCKGVEDLLQFGLAPCDPAVVTYTDAKVWMWANGNILTPNGAIAYPACVAAGTSISGGGNSTTTCTATNQGAAGTYPANWSVQFGAFGTADNCITNVSGNPISGASPFSLPGVVQNDFGDGINRDVSTVCVVYEDPCDGSKSTTCVRFISDMSAMSASAAACDETCPGAADGKIYVYDIIGGSDDPNGDGLYTDGNMGAYVLDVVSGPATGQIFTYLGGTTWEATGLAPGVYTIDVYDSLAPTDTFDDDSDDLTAACGAACPIQVVVEVLAGPVISCAVENVVAGDCDVAGSATLAVDKLTRVSNGELIASSGPGTVPGDFATVSSSTTTVTSGMFAGCPDDILTIAGVVEICIVNFQNVTNNSGADLDGTQIFLSLNGSGPVGSISNGGAFGGGGSLSAGPVTMCYSAEAGAGAGADNAGGSWGAFFAGLPGNGLSIGLIGSDGFGTGDTYSYDDITITINDQACSTELDIAAFCGTAGPDEGDMAGAITSADQTITWTSDAAGGEAAAEPFTYASFTGTGEEGISFDMGAASAAVGPGVTICYSMEAYVPGNNFTTANDFVDMTGLATTCYQGACCPVTCAPICFTTIACFDCIDPTPPALTGDLVCEGDAATGLTATCDPCADIAGFTGTSTVTWYSDAAGTAMVGTGATYVPADTAPGTYTYYSTCTCSYNDPDASTCESTVEMVDFVINGAPDAAFTCPAPTCNSGILDLAPLDNNAVAGTTGAWSGTGAAVVTGGANPGDVATVDPGVLTVNTVYSLTLTLTSPDGCTSEVSCTFSLDTDCDANGGQF